MNANTSMHTMKWLLRREFWENRGGFFWAPIVTAAIFFTFTLMGVIGAEAFKAHIVGDIKIGVSLKHLTERLDPDDLARIGPAIDAAMLGFGQVLQVVLGFVLFFYLLGALYDDRRDRSVLFWKSLPISDRETVVSKLVSAALVAPVIATVVSIALQFAVLALMSLYVMLYGINPLTVIWGPAEPLMIWVRTVASIPLNALWALPAIGWLLMVSAFARSKPILWAALVPIGLAVLVGWFDFLSRFGVPDHRVWKYGVARVLGGIFPGSWQLESGPVHIAKGVEMMFVNGAARFSEMASVLISPSMWIGIVAGLAMMTAAVRLRRWRDDS